MRIAKTAAQGRKQLLTDALALDPAHIKGILVRQGVVVEQLHRHRRRQLLRWLEQSHQQDRPQELVDHPLADPQLPEQRERIKGVVALVHRRAAVQIEHRHQQSGDAESIGYRQALEIVDRGEGLPQRTGQLRAITKYRCRGLQPLGRPEGTAGERGEHIAQPEFVAERIDVGVIPPEPAGAGFKRLTAGGGQRRAAGGIRQAIHKGDAHPGFTERFGGTPSAPAGTNHHHMRRVGRRLLLHRHP